MPVEKHCSDFHSIPLSRGNQDSYFKHFHDKADESDFADKRFTVVLNTVKNNIIGIFSKANLPRDFHLPIQNVFVHFLIKLQETREFLENL